AAHCALRQSSCLSRAELHKALTPSYRRPPRAYDRSIPRRRGHCLLDVPPRELSLRRRESLCAQVFVALPYSPPVRFVDLLLQGGRCAADLKRRAGEFDREWRSEEHTSELQSRGHLVCRLLLEKK